MGRWALRARKRLCARVARPTLLGGPSASPLDGRLVGNAAVLKGAFALALVGGSSLLVAKPHNGFGAAEGERHDG